VSVEVRLAVPGDVPALLDLYRQLSAGFGDHPTATPEQAAAAVAEIGARPDRALLVGLLDGRVAGTAHLLLLGPNLTRSGRPWAILEHVVVDRAARRRGVGRALMDEAIRRAGEAGCYKLELSSNERRTEAHAFYRASGFEARARTFRHHFP
jgi:GNAT superfamily N-acetyltransferase